MFDEELKCKQLENKIQELNSLDETNNDLRDELKEALSKKSRATRTGLTAKAKKLASHRLEKWHIEREAYLVVQQQTFSDMDALACRGQEL